MMTDIVARRPSAASKSWSASATKSSTGVLSKNAVRIAANPSSSGSHTMSNSTDAVLSVAFDAFQPLLARVVTSASPVSRESVTSLTFVISTHTGAA